MGGPARLGRADRARPPVPRPGPAAGGADRQVLRRDRDRKLGDLDPHPPARTLRHRDGGAGHPRAGHRRAGHRAAGRHPARASRRPVAGPRRGSRHPGRLGARRLHAGVLAGADPAAGLRPAAPAAAGGRPVRPEPRLQPPARQSHSDARGRQPGQRQLGHAGQHAHPPDPARAGGGRLPGRGDRADGARAGARHHGRGARADGAVARLPRTDRIRHVRHAAGLEPGRRGARASLRLLAGQHVPGGVDLRLARARQLRGGIGVHAGYPGDRRRHAVRRGHLRGRQRGRGPGTGGARPEDQAP